MGDFKISIQQIEIFLTVARCKSISTAARKLYISQPAVSKWLHEMEETLGKQLFIRSNRGITLSSEGELLYAELHASYHKFRVMLERLVLSGSAYKKQDALNIGTQHDPDTIYAMYAFIDLLKNRHPEIKVFSELYSFQELYDKLSYGELDFAFTFSGGEVEPAIELEMSPLYRVERFFWLPAEWDAPTETEMDFEFLKGKDLLIETKNNLNDAIIACRAHGFTPAHVRYVNSFLLLAYLISTGEGFTVWSQYPPEVFSRRLRIVPFLNAANVPPTNILAVWRKGYASEMQAKAIDVVKDSSLRRPEADPIGNGVNSRW
jgi:DNA-binding transcriptional LysR family regulator